MKQARRKMIALALLAPALAGCGAAGGQGDRTTTPAKPPPATATTPQAHPQAVEPTAGVGAAAPGSAPGGGETIVGDPNAHAPSLAEVKRELRLLNLCGGVTNAANAAPVATSKGPGFVPDPGTSQTQGQLPVLTARLDSLAKALGLTIYGISGYRTPAHSVAVGGFADDPHTKGLAEDIGVGSLLRSSAAQISEAQLAQYGLYRPFDPSDDPNNTEVNHIQLIPSGGALPPAQAATRWNPDPRCR
jgi:predicted small lipoprotein YifL